MHRQVQVLNFMRALARKRQVIVFIAIHDLNQALRFADQVLVIADNTAQGSGPSAEVITESMLRQVYKVEARIEQCSRGERHILIDDIV
jgi:iron complex transport system ATP-binding protein